jgi:hypothetical protein
MPLLIALLTCTTPTLAEKSAKGTASIDSMILREGEQCDVKGFKLGQLCFANITIEGEPARELYERLALQYNLNIVGSRCRRRRLKRTTPVCWGGLTRYEPNHNQTLLAISCNSCRPPRMQQPSCGRWDMLVSRCSSFVSIIPTPTYSCPSSMNSFCANEHSDQKIDTAYHGEWVPEG